MAWDKRTETTRDNRATTNWAAGPWDAEPDRVEWITEAGLPGIILRQSRDPHYPSGHLCGYVGVEPGHPWHGKDDSYGEPHGAPIEAHDAAHGGITYGADCHGEVCHVPAPGEPEHLWWLGFDARHSGDVAPIDTSPLYSRSGDPFAFGTYKTIDFMRARVEALAAAAKAAA